ncbi:ArsR/SmtB family transcription factor [Spirillospora sp. CA-255316]
MTTETQEDALPQALRHPRREELDLSEILCALADPNRLRVVAALVEQPPGSVRPYSWFGLPIGKAGRTHHFRVLREAGLITVEQYGNRTAVSLRRDDIESRFPGLLSAIRAGTAPRDTSGEPASADPDDL